MKMTTQGGEVIPILGEFRPKIKDIAYSLSRQRRFTGHCDITVAQHAVVVSYLVPQNGIYPMEGLLHDMQEYITGDMSTPMKQAMQAVCEQFNLQINPFDFIDERITTICRQYFKMPIQMSKVVHQADGDAARIEAGLGFDRPARKAFTVLGLQPNVSGTLDPMDAKTAFKIWDSPTAYSRFLTRFVQLGGLLNG